MNLPAYGVLNVWKVAAGTGEAVPGPTMLRSSRRSDPSYNRSIREVGVVPGGRRRRPYYRLSARDNRTRREGRAAASFMRHAQGRAGECHSWLGPPSRTQSENCSERSTGRPRPIPDVGSTRSMTRSTAETSWSGRGSRARAGARDPERASHRAATEPVNERGRDNHDERNRDQVLRSSANAGLAEPKRERGRGRSGDDPTGGDPGNERPLAPMKRRAQGRQRHGKRPADSTSTAMNATLTQPISAIWCGVTRAETMMNRIPIRKVVSVPIRSRQPRRSFARWIACPLGSIPRGCRLARIAPITRPVIRPVSSRSRSAQTTIATTNINVPGTAWDCVGLKPVRPRPAPRPRRQDRSRHRSRHSGGTRRCPGRPSHARRPQR